MITLFIDTSSSDVSIAIVLGQKIIASKIENIPNAHSVYTVSFLDEVIKMASIKIEDIDNILVVTGPGSFTGVRIGVTIAKTFAYLRKIKIIGVSSLKMLSLSCDYDNYCLSLIDANHDNYYVGLYDKFNNEIVKEHFSKKDDVLKIVAKYNPVIVSNGDINTDYLNVSKTNLDIVKIVSYYNNVSDINPHLINPNYLKLPQALEVKND